MFRKVQEASSRASSKFQNESESSLPSDKQMNRKAKYSSLVLLYFPDVFGLSASNVPDDGTATSFFTSAFRRTQSNLLMMPQTGGCALQLKRRYTDILCDGATL